jgi:four helix bundle protein
MMPNKGTFRDLVVWQKSILLAQELYHKTQAMPETEKFGLTAQMRRAVVSVASNIAEGNARRTTADCIRFLAIARGSLAELETQLIIATNLEMLVDTERLLDNLQEVRRILQALIDSLRRKQS